MRPVRLELTRLTARASKTRMATNYITDALIFCRPPLRLAAIFLLCSSLLGLPLLPEPFVFPLLILSLGCRTRIELVIAESQPAVLPLN